MSHEEQGRGELFIYHNYIYYLAVKSLVTKKANKGGIDCRGAGIYVPGRLERY